MHKHGPIVSSLSLSFKKATKLTEDHEEAKKQHRETLHGLIQSYIDNVAEGKAEGIRTAKELVEVMKMDLLLMGEVTERTENALDEARVSRITKILDEGNDSVKDIMGQIMKDLNDINDLADQNSVPKKDKEQEEETIEVSEEELEQMAQNIDYGSIQEEE
jgi:hypothetical protein